MQRVHSILSVGALAAVMALGASPAVAQSPASAEPVNITLLTHWPPDQVARMEEAVAAFEAANAGITVEVRAVPFGDLLTTLRTQAASPTGPTVVSIYDLWLPELVAEGVAASAPESVVADIQANWPENIVQGQTIDGQTYGYPNEVNTYQLLYNKRLFQEAGIAAPPATWDELVSTAQALTKTDESGAITQQGFTLINSWPAGVVHPWLSMVESNGGSMLNGTTPTLDTPEVLATTQLYYDLVNTYKVTDPALGTSNASTAGPFIDNFAAGNSAMMILSNPFQSALQAAMGDAFADVGVAPIPVGPSGTGPANVSYSWLTVVNARASAEQQAAAWQFLTWLDDEGTGTKASAMGDLLMAMGIMPSRVSDQVAYADELGSAFLKPYVDALSTAVPFPMVLGGEQLSVMLQQQIENVEFGQATPEDAMSTAQSDATDILSQYYP